MITEAVVREALDRLTDRKCNRGRRCQWGYTYVIRSPAVGLIKIGMSDKPIKRLTEIQAVNADSLRLDALVHGSWLETELHALLAEHRRHGEWFATGCPIPATSGDLCFGCLCDRTKTMNIETGVQRSIVHT